jgi:hypothetical protein
MVHPELLQMVTKAAAKIAKSLLLRMFFASSSQPRALPNFIIGSENKKLQINPIIRLLMRDGTKNTARNIFLPWNALFRAKAKTRARKFWNIVTVKVYLRVAFTEW